MENDKCGCEDKTVENNSKQDASCCGDNVESADAGCGCGAMDYPDLSKMENPDKPEFIADEEFIKEFEDYAHSLGIKSVGYTLLTPDLLISDKFVQYANTIVLTMEMNNEIFETAPGEDAKDLNDRAYVKLGIITTKLSDYLRDKGYATEIAHPYGGLVNFSPLAQKAGLGYMGNNGLLITPELGPGVKISAIFTSIANIPFNEKNEHLWIPDYCEKCGKCIKACPQEALQEIETCCGGPEVELIQKQCIGCSQGCTYCIEACPFKEKGYEHIKNKMDKINATLKERQNQKFNGELWDKWTKQNSYLFKGLDDGAAVAFSMKENSERIVLFEKVEDLKISIKDLKNLNELENCADLLFIIGDEDMGKLLDDNNTVNFIDLLQSGKIEIYGLKSQIQLTEKYMPFLNNLGLSFGRGCCG